MNGPLGDPAHVGADLKNVLLEKSTTGDSICKKSQTRWLLGACHLLDHSFNGFLGWREGMLSVL